MAELIPGDIWEDPETDDWILIAKENDGKKCRAATIFADHCYCHITKTFGDMERVDIQNIKDDKYKYIGNINSIKIKFQKEYGKDE